MRLEPSRDYLSCDYCGNVHVPEPNEDGVRELDEDSASDCPVCAIPLVHAAIDGQRIFYCRHCRGMLVPMDIFVPLVEDLRSRRDASTEIVYPFDSSELKRRIQCPQCGVAMDTHVYGGGGNVVISVCEHCESNWLDHGELDRIVRASDPHYALPRT